ncbi:MAG: hypothetical protein DRP02_12550 [Candidatus Gerdarchaeota archaeon]|nr:MAG: hypothetical protein DRP02_12550 [Candidatus Gerdarchaeota archaeon]
MSLDRNEQFPIDEHFKEETKTNRLAVISGVSGVLSLLLFLLLIGGVMIIDRNPRILWDIRDIMTPQELQTLGRFIAFLIFILSVLAMISGFVALILNTSVKKYNTKENYRAAIAGLLLGFIVIIFGKDILSGLIRGVVKF